jgi:hypothetical protein
MARRVSVADNGIEIGRLQIHMGEKRASNIKNHILDARFGVQNNDDESTQKNLQTRSKFRFHFRSFTNLTFSVSKQDTVGWKILRESLTSINSVNKIGSRVSKTDADGLRMRNSGMMIATMSDSRNSLNNTLMGGQLGQQLRQQRSNARLGARGSHLHLDTTIQEEGNQGQPTTPVAKPGWKKLRESVKQKEFQQNLTLRKSNLQLHQMDECLMPRNSNISRISRISRTSRISRKSGINLNPDINSREQQMGFRKMSVGDHRRQSLHHTISLSDDLMIMRELHREKSREYENRSSCWGGFKYICYCKKRAIWVE